MSMFTQYFFTCFFLQKKVFIINFKKVFVELLSLITISSQKGEQKDSCKPMQKNCFTLFDHCPDYGPNLCKEHMLTLSQRKSIFRDVT